MTATQSLNHYNIALRYFKNEADAIAFVKEIEVAVDNKFSDKIEILATKSDIAALRTDTEVLRTEIEKSKADLLKWLIVLFLPFYVGMIVFQIKQFGSLTIFVEQLDSGCFSFYESKIIC